MDYNLILTTLITTNIGTFVYYNHKLNKSYKDTTGVNNRAKFELDVHKAFEFVVVDIDNLKMMNDNYGHIQGDLLIQSVVDALTDVYNKFEVYRYGGDEFIVLNSNVNKSLFQKLILLHYIQHSEQS